MAPNGPLLQEPTRTPLLILSKRCRISNLSIYRSIFRRYHVQEREARYSNWKMALDLDKCYDLIHKAVRHAGEIIRSRIWSSKGQIDIKSSELDLVTEVDKQVEEYLISTILKSFPNHLFIGEETVGVGGKLELTDAPTWVIDPIDGTMNFVHGHPNVCVSVALLVNKEPLIGVVYNPVLDHFFEARKGMGCKLNGSLIYSSNETDLKKALIGFEFGTTRNPVKTKNVTDNVKNLITKVHGIRSPGSAALNMALVALGSADAYYEYGIQPWDVAAGWLLVTEAGGVVFDPSGGDFDVLSRKVLCAGTKELAQSLSKELIPFDVGLLK